MTDNLGLVVELLLDDAAKAKALAGMKDIEKGIESVGATSEKVSKEQAQADKEFQASMEGKGEQMLAMVNERNKRLIEESKNKVGFTGADTQRTNERKVAEENAKEKAKWEAYANELSEKYGREQYDRLTKESDKRRENEKEKEAAALQGKLRAEQIAAAEKKITDEYHRQMEVSSRMRRTAMAMGRTGQLLAIGGTAVVGGAFAMAQAEANRQKSSGGPVDATTTKWLEANKRIELSTRRIAQTAERIILPYLQKASELAERASKYIEQNPEVVKAILAAGATAAVIGSALVVLSKGVRFIADMKYIAANTYLAMAMEKHTAAVLAGGPLGLAGGGSGALMTIGKTIGAGIVLALAAYLGAKGGLAIGNKIAGTNQTMGDVGQTALKIGVMGVAGLTSVLEKLHITSKGSTASVFNFLASVTGVDGKAKKAADALDDLSASSEALAETAKKNAEGWKIVRDLEQDNLDAERKYNTQRADILSDSARAVGDVNAKYGATTGKIKSGLAESIGKLTADFNKSNLDAEKQFQSERADIVRSGGEAIKQIQSDTQEQLRQLEEDYAAQKADLMASRDAGGLVLAQREFEKQKERISEGGAREIAQKRQDMKVQLADLQQSHAEQRAERQAEYAQAIIDARAQAAQQMAEAAQARQQELAEIARARALQLYELQRSYNEERRQRIQAAYNSIKDIGGALEVERAYKLKYYGVMLTDVTTFMAKYQAALKAGLTGGSAVPKMAAGGYSSGGLTMLHPGEFVMSPATARAAEGLIGNRLTQSNVLRGGGASIQLVDNRRFDSRIPQSERNAIREESLEDARILITDMLKVR